MILPRFCQSLNPRLIGVEESHPQAAERAKWAARDRGLAPDFDWHPFHPTPVARLSSHRTIFLFAVLFAALIDFLLMPESPLSSLEVEAHILKNRIGYDCNGGVSCYWAKRRFINHLNWRSWAGNVRAEGESRRGYHPESSEVRKWTRSES